MIDVGNVEPQTDSPLDLSPQSDVIDLRHWLQASVRPHLRMILATTAGAGVLAFAVALLLPNYYESRASVVVTATPSEMEVNDRIAMSSDLIDAVLADARAQGQLAADESAVLRSEADTTHPSNPTPMLTLFARTVRPAPARAVAEIWANRFMAIATKELAENRKSGLAALRTDLAAAKTDVEQQEAALEKVLQTSDREQVEAQASLQLDLKQQQLALLMTDATEINRRLDALVSGASKANFELQLLPRPKPSETPDAAASAAGLTPGLGVTAIRSAIAAENQLLLAAKGSLASAKASVARVTKEVETILAELETLPATVPADPVDRLPSSPQMIPNPLRGELSRRLARSRIQLEIDRAEQAAAETEVRDRQARSDALNVALSRAEAAENFQLSEGRKSRQEFLLRDAQADERENVAAIKKLTAEINQGNLSLTGLKRQLSAKSERAVATVNAAKDKVSRLTAELAAAEKLAAAPPKVRLVAVEAATRVATVRLALAFAVTALAFGLALAVATMRGGVRASAA